MPELYLMLIRIVEDLLGDRRLADWADEIEADYMKRFGALGFSAAHVVLNGPWHFALLFPGSAESVSYLEESIRGKVPGAVQEILTMRAVQLDDFTRSLRSGGEQA